jgi:hypothetical protein
VVSGKRTRAGEICLWTGSALAAVW